MEGPESTAEGVYVWRCGVEAGSQGSLSTEGVIDKVVVEAGFDKQEPGGVEVENPDIDTRDGTTQEETGRAEETMAGLDTVSVSEVGGLRPCTIRGGEETLGGTVEDGTDDASGGGADSALRYDITGGLEAEEGGPETLVRDGEPCAGDVDTDS